MTARDPGGASTAADPARIRWQRGGFADPLRLVIGDKAAKRLAAALDLHTVGDLLRHYPRRYEKRGELTDLAGLRDGEYVTVQAEVASASVRRCTTGPARSSRRS